MPRRAARWLTAVVLVVAALGTGGCATSGPVTLSTEQVVSMAMKTERKRAVLPQDFPAQVPVIEGTIGPASFYDEGNGLWIYEISAEHTPVEVVEWYKRAYTNANWIVIAEESAATGDGEAVTLELEKGAGARSVITVRPADEGAALVEATVGIGAPIGETY
jgi:hypothetical protein